MSPLLTDPRSPLGKARILVVEGEDEFHLLIWMLEHMEIPGQIEIRPPYADVAPLGEYLAMLVVASGIDTVTHIGIMCDAESREPASVRESVSSALASVFPGAPSVAANAEFVACPFEGRTVRVGAFIAPDGTSRGMLEDLCLSPSAVRESDATPCVDRYLDCLAEAGIVNPHWPKRRLHAYLAACDDPTLKLGEAGKAGYWHFDDPCWQPLKDFLKELAGG